MVRGLELRCGNIKLEAWRKQKLREAMSVERPFRGKIVDVSDGPQKGRIDTYGWVMLTHEQEYSFSGKYGLILQSIASPMVSFL